MGRNKTKRIEPVYPAGTVRARRWHGLGDVRGYVPPSGWVSTAELLDVHPLTGAPLGQSSWWIIEIKR